MNPTGFIVHSAICLPLGIPDILRWESRFALSRTRKSRLLQSFDGTRMARKCRRVSQYVSCWLDLFILDATFPEGILVLPAGNAGGRKQDWPGMARSGRNLARLSWTFAPWRSLGATFGTGFVERFGKTGRAVAEPAVERSITLHRAWPILSVPSLPSFGE